MKLKQLTEDWYDDLARAAEKNLVVNVAEVSYGVPEGSETSVSMIYIITDVPRISGRQFANLRNVSLRHQSEIAHRGSAVSMYQLNSKDGRPPQKHGGRQAALQWQDIPYEKEVIKLPWKQFVDKMIADYPYDGDDFDE